MSVSRFGIIKHYWLVNLAVLLPIPAIISSVAHFMYATVLLDKYNVMIRAGFNWLRWIEYSLSAGFMIIIVALLCGVNDLFTLICFWVLNLLLQLGGGLAEIGVSQSKPGSMSHGTMAVTHIQTNRNLQFISSVLLLLGVLQFLVTWVLIGVSFFSAVHESSQSRNIPDIVWAIVFVMFALFSSFAVLFYANWPRRPENKRFVQDFQKVEATYIVLSFVSKTVLQWMVVGGAMRGYEET